MSKEIARVVNIHVAQFFGGVQRGTCLQLTDAARAGGGSYIQVTSQEARVLADLLKRFAKGEQFPELDESGNRVTPRRQHAPDGGAK